MTATPVALFADPLPRLSVRTALLALYRPAVRGRRALLVVAAALAAGGALAAGLLPWSPMSNADLPAGAVLATEFGAVADDGRDDTAAIQRALDSGAPVVYLPAGEFLVTRIEVGDGQTLQGAGVDQTRLKLPDQTVATAREVGLLGLTFQEGAQTVTFRDFEYDGNADGPGNRDWLGRDPFGRMGANGIYLGSYRRRTPPRLAVIENVYIHDTARNGIVWGDHVEVQGRNWRIRNSDGDHLVYDSSDFDGALPPSLSVVDGVVLEGHARGPMLVSNNTTWRNVTFRDVARNPAESVPWGSNLGAPYQTLGLIGSRAEAEWGSRFEGVIVEDLDPGLLLDGQPFTLLMAGGPADLGDVTVTLTGGTSRAFQLVDFPRRLERPSAVSFSRVRVEGAGPQTRLATRGRSEGETPLTLTLTDIEVRYTQDSADAPLLDLRSSVQGLAVRGLRIRGGAPVLAHLRGRRGDRFENITIEGVDADRLGARLIVVYGGEVDNVRVADVTAGGAPADFVATDDRRARGVGRVGAVAVRVGVR